MQEQQLQLSPAKAAIQMLTTAHELYKKSTQTASRLLYHIGGLMAREHLATEDIDSAKTLLESIAGTNMVLLASVLASPQSAGVTGFCSKPMHFKDVPASRQVVQCCRETGLNFLFDSAACGNLAKISHKFLQHTTMPGTHLSARSTYKHMSI